MQNHRILNLVSAVFMAAAARMTPIQPKAFVPGTLAGEPEPQAGGRRGGGSNARTRRAATKRKNQLRHRRACRRARG